VVVTELSPNPTKASVQVVASGASNLCGYAFAEKTGKATAKLIIRDGTSGGKEMFPITLNPSESTREVWAFQSEGPRGIPVTSGAIYIEVVSGEIEGIVIWE
jgi:hypothetical protein